MPPLPSIATMRYRPPSSSPGANCPCDRDECREEIVRESRGALDGAGELAATVRVAKESWTAAPHEAHARLVSWTSLPQEAH
jgi:hypothetical protein